MKLSGWMGVGFLTFMIARMNLKSEYDELITSISARYGNSPALVKAIIKQESGFNPLAHNTKGEDSRGLGQINAPTAQGLGVTDLNKLFRPDYNIEIMNKLLVELRGRYNGITSDMIAAYNAGKVRLDDSGKYRNSIYVEKVFSNYLLYTLFLL
jgi:soluble lytic murein transglycosylase-like protein